MEDQYSRIPSGVQKRVSQDWWVDCHFFYVLFLHLCYFLSAYEGCDAQNGERSQVIFSHKWFYSTRRIQRAFSWAWFLSQSSTSSATFSTISANVVFLLCVHKRHIPASMGIWAGRRRMQKKGTWKWRNPAVDQIVANSLLSSYSCRWRTAKNRWTEDSNRRKAL